jgi:hypothetical protein
VWTIRLSSFLLVPRAARTRTRVPRGACGTHARRGATAAERRWNEMGRVRSSATDNRLSIFTQKKVSFASYQVEHYLFVRTTFAFYFASANVVHVLCTDSVVCVRLLAHTQISPITSHTSQQRHDSRDSAACVSPSRLSSPQSIASRPQRLSYSQSHTHIPPYI